MSNNAISEKFKSYPPQARKQLSVLRKLIFDVAKREGINDLEETLKWGEPSYVCATGSTLRIDWKPKAPDRYSIFFNCNSSLVETFREIYPDTFNYQGNREIFFLIGQPLPVVELKQCIAAALGYHRRKTKPLLGLLPDS